MTNCVRDICCQTSFISFTAWPTKTPVILVDFRLQGYGYTSDPPDTYKPKPNPYLNTNPNFTNPTSILCKDSRRLYLAYSLKSTKILYAAKTVNDKPPRIPCGDNNRDVVVLSSWPKPLREFTRFIGWMQTERRGGRKPRTKPSDLGCESAGRLLPSTSTIAIYYYSADTHFTVRCTTAGGKLSRPRRWSKGMQPVPEAVHCSGCRSW